MGILEEITNMKNQGMADEEISRNLQEKGIPPKEIQDAMNQSQIKNAVAGEEPDMTEQAPETEEPYAPQTQEMGVEEYAPQGDSSQVQEQQEYYPQQQAYDQNYYQSGGTDADTIIEIADQVFTEKIQKLQKQLEIFNEFKTLTQVQVDDIDKRLKRIENTIDKLQTAILNEVGSYGKRLGSVRKEIDMMQTSFRKKHSTKTIHRKKPVKKTSKKK